MAINSILKTIANLTTSISNTFSINCFLTDKYVNERRCSISKINTVLQVNNCRIRIGLREDTGLGNKVDVIAL